jgi:hypothetical protein
MVSICFLVLPRIPKGRKKVHPFVEVLSVVAFPQSPRPRSGFCVSIPFWSRDEDLERELAETNMKITASLILHCHLLIAIRFTHDYLLVSCRVPLLLEMHKIILALEYAPSFDF